MRKAKYEVDPHNRLIESGGGLRRVIDGNFKISADSQLEYHVKKPVARDEPQQVKFRGHWALDGRHRLVFSLDQWGRQIAGNKLVLKTGLLGVSGNEAVFSLESRDFERRRKISLLKFDGLWQADQKNRLTFSFGAESGYPGVLTFKGTWELDRNYELTYACERPGYARAKQAVRWKGFWQVSGRRRLTYIVNKESGSGFDFKVTLQDASLERLVFTCGIGAEPQKRKIAFFGSWRFDRKMGLSFEVPCENGRIQRLVFGASARWQGGLEADVRLKAARGEDLGAVLTLSKDIAGGRAFFRLLREEGQIGVFAGYGRTW